MKLRHFGYAAALLALSAVTQAAPPKRERCYLPGLEDAADCITLTVPLDWAKPSGAKIQVFTAVLPALSRDAARDAFVMVPGGPGQSGDALVSLTRTAFREIRQTRDLVLIYPRGTARSTPLDCKMLEGEATLGKAALVAAVKSCVASQKVNTAFFTAVEIVRDMEEMRRVLKYPQLSLWGGSFGSRIVQHYARDYPAATRLAILDAAAPAGVSIAETAPAAAEAALASIDLHCRTDSSCRKSAPALRADINSILADFASGPRTFSIVDPATGRRKSIEIDQHYLAGIIHLTLYSPPSRALLPQLITAAKQGRFEPLIAMGAASGGALESQMSIGANFSALCAEDMQITNEAKLAATSRKSFLGALQADNLKLVCPLWPHGKMPTRFLMPFKSSVPTLVLSGALDPITPPASGRIAASYFSNATHVEIPASAHISSTFGCAPRQIAQFVLTASTKNADWNCIQKAKPPAPLGTANG
jgi:pimeloyl-ACP methyl ester carboxylesterase